MGISNSTGFTIIFYSLIKKPRALTHRLLSFFSLYSVRQRGVKNDQYLEPVDKTNFLELLTAVNKSKCTFLLHCKNNLNVVIISASFGELELEPGRNLQYSAWSHCHPSLVTSHVMPRCSLYRKKYVICIMVLHMHGYFFSAYL